MNLEAFVLGCGGMMPLPNRHLTSLLLRREGDLFLFDAGEGTQVSLRRLNLRWKKISAIFISHTHADHVTGLPGLLMLSSQVDRDEPLYIYGPPRIAEYIESSRRVLDMYINYEIIIRETSEAGICHQEADFQVRTFPLRHTKTCYGYALEEHARPGEFNPARALELGVPRGPLWSRLQAGESVQSDSGTMVEPSAVLGPARSGRKVSFVTDSLYFPEIAAEVAGSDLFVCEGMFEHALLDSAVEKKHMTAVQAAMLARDAGGVKQLALIHYSPRYTEYDLKRVLDEAREIFPATILSRDRMQLPLEYVD
ncbi:MAG: ribonuclease Z [Spirochaetes bacterium GWD1_61_31]|nr:MAG: ribonuclease Z [Spirochaetes bacterium GWB1_60_80]OHD35478.1 MAG: ribonuclease Z [Spirochaetes bacterium GWC1_61_12]OHD38275.1 MAG: ribonuclease Z [Spirochaetes bacterium GWD1_61_31]OHD42506.1 MAG: ribonuclease Z [Spirochaetes bacterium GWE1_60_18]OHD58234.1 MAG: ribonuclease Z [Spirochaetes bacterium GWF1_60_12]HAP44292.1 ribonuclease Z [Spirochaetaceae bacterium]